MIEECKRYRISPPEFQEMSGLTIVTFRAPIGTTPQVVALLESAQQPRSREELQRVAGLKDRRHFRRAYLEHLVAVGWLEMTISDKSHSRQQRYRTTAVGLAVLQEKSSETV